MHMFARQITAVLIVAWSLFLSAAPIVQAAAVANDSCSCCKHSARKVIRVDRNSRGGRTSRGREKINAEGVRITLLEGMRLYLITCGFNALFAFLPLL
jgi:hypothetical protein